MTNLPLNITQSKKDYLLPEGDFYLSNTLDIPEDTRIIGAGKERTIIRTDLLGKAFNVKGSNVTLEGFSLLGKQRDTKKTEDMTFKNRNVGIYAGKTGDARPNQQPKQKGLVIRDCQIRGFGESGIELELLEDALIEDNLIEFMGHSGVVTYGSKNIRVRHNHIRDIFRGEESGNVQKDESYGIAFTHHKISPGSEHPVSRECWAVGNLIERIPLWEGIDSHTGSDTYILNNIIKECSRPIMVGEQTDSLAKKYRMRNIMISGNHVQYTGQHPHPEKVNDYSYAIALHGNAYEGLEVVNAQIVNNIVTGPFKQPLYANAVSQLVIKGNILEKFEDHGMMLGPRMRDLICNDNVVRATNQNPSAIYVRRGNKKHPKFSQLFSTGIIANNWVNGRPVSVINNLQVYQRSNH